MDILDLIITIIISLQENRNEGLLRYFIYFIARQSLYVLKCSSFEYNVELEKNNADNEKEKTTVERERQ